MSQKFLKIIAISVAIFVALETGNNLKSMETTEDDIDRTGIIGAWWRNIPEELKIKVRVEPYEYEPHPIDRFMTPFIWNISQALREETHYERIGKCFAPNSYDRLDKDKTKVWRGNHWEPTEDEKQRETRHWVKMGRKKVQELQKEEEQNQEVQELRKIKEKENKKFSKQIQTMNELQEKKEFEHQEALKNAKTEGEDTGKLNTQEEIAMKMLNNKTIIFSLELISELTKVPLERVSKLKDMI